jgi:hypothetical protein
MSHDFELVRLVLLHLEAAERSPPEPIFIDIAGLSSRFSALAERISESLALLQERGFIEGPGPYGVERYIFRKLTKKGKILVAALRDRKDWEEAKALYLPMAERDEGR